jgi:hypothetical protein
VIETEIGANRIWHSVISPDGVICTVVRWCGGVSRALSRNTDGSASGVIGAVLDKIASEGATS